MSPPSGYDYQIAVQNPRTAFIDAELCKCVAETTPLGLPKPYSGGFTTTFRLVGHGQDWAIRCFTKQVPDLQRRYEAIGRFLSQRPNTLFVQAQCLAQGIRVNSVWHPAIKMGWVDGEPLNAFIERNIVNPTVIAGLAPKFLNLVRTLRELGVAHGDLQHGNIIVKNGALQLIDYDGIFLPEIAGLGSSEIGHINYQHPLRTGAQYGLDIDHFSSILIYLGLLALSISPKLWKKYDNSENILFRRDDFLDPEQSPLMKELLALPQISLLVAQFRSICEDDFDGIPTLDQFIAGNFVPARRLSAVRPAYVVRNQYPILDATLAQSLLMQVGQRVEVMGAISDYHKGHTRYGQPYFFLNFGTFPRQTLTLVLWSESIAAMNQAGRSIETLVGKWVSVTGVLSRYGRRAQIVIETPTQIQVLSGESEVKRRLETASPSFTPAETRHDSEAIRASVPSQSGSVAGRSVQQPVVSSIFSSPRVPTAQTSSTKKEAEVFNRLYANQPTSPSRPSPPPVLAPKITRQPAPSTARYVILGGVMVFGLLMLGLFLAAPKPSVPAIPSVLSEKPAATVALVTPTYIATVASSRSSSSQPAQPSPITIADASPTAMPVTTVASGPMQGALSIRDIEWNAQQYRLIDYGRQIEVPMVLHRPVSNQAASDVSLDFVLVVDGQEFHPTSIQVSEFNSSSLTATGMRPVAIGTQQSLGADQSLAVVLYFETPLGRSSGEQADAFMLRKKVFVRWLQYGLQTVVNLVG